LVALSVAFLPRWRAAPPAAARTAAGVLGGGRARLVLLVGLGYAALGVALEMSGIAWAQEIVLVVSAALLSFLLMRMGVTRAVLVGTLLYLPNIGLFYGLQDWLGISARSLALIDTTISAPLNQLAMVPMLVLIAKTAPRGGEATMFAIMASLMNLALSASQLFTRYLNEGFAV